MSISYQNKVNKRLIAQAIVNESHTIGITGVATVTLGLIKLVEVPEAPAPLSTVSIPGYTEIFSGSPIGTQFLVDYVTGVITFNVSQDGNAILVSYNGLGSEFAAEDINELQGPVGVALNYNGSLSNNIVKPATISNTITDDFIFPRDITASRDLIAVTKVNTDEVKGRTGNLLLEPLSNSVTGIKLANASGTVILDVDTTNLRIGINNSAPTVELDVTGDVNVSKTITQSETYSATGHSHQGVAGDETLDPGVGSSSPTDPKFIAAAMFNVHDNGSPLTATANYLAGVIGADSITGSQATSYPKGAVLAQISDGVTASDGAVVAYIDGDSSVTLANAAFKAMQNNSQIGSGFTYGLDLFGAAHDGYLELSIKNAAIRMDHEVCILNNSGAPTNGVTGSGFAQIGSLYIDNSTGDLYSNTGTKVTPVWTIFDTGTSGANIHLSNLSSVAINTSLLPGLDNTIDLGSSSTNFRNAYLKTSLILQQTGAGTNAITLQSPTSVTSYTLKLPTAQGGVNTALTNDGSGNLSWVTAGSGTVNTGVAGALAYYATSTDAVSTLPAGSTVSVGTLQFQNSTNQLAFTASANILTISAPSPAGSITYTIPDLGTSANFLLDTGSNAGPVGIGEAPVASAILDVASTTQGFLPPRMTTAQRNAIGSPAKGLIVYDTDLDQFMGYSGSWVVLG